jgi:hypothetical protein
MDGIPLVAPEVAAERDIRAIDGLPQSTEGLSVTRE